MLDDRDRLILAMLQENADHPVAAVAARVSLSPSACSRRVQRLEAEGYVARRVALLDRAKMGLPTTIFVVVKTQRHSADWLDAFRRAIADVPEIVEVHRLTGSFDYILKLALPNVEHYDAVYKRLVARVEFFDMSAFISMETLKSGTALPTRFA